MNFEYKNLLVKLALNKVFQRIGDTMVSSFVKERNKSMGTETKRLSVEIVYVVEDQAFTQELEVGSGTTLEQAIKQSDILQQYPQINLTVNRVGIYGELRSLHDHVNDGDRIEIYRPLLADPKDARRHRADKAKKQKLAEERR